MKTNYQELKEAKIERFNRLAKKNDEESTNRYRTAKQIGDFIPMGQPILVGHHSEGKHRRDISKIDTNMRKSIEASEKSEYYAEKAKNLENDTTISSDDPNAIERLEEKLNKLKEMQDLMKGVNKIVKNKKYTDIQKVELMVKEGLLKESNAIKILEPDYCGRIGFASYQLTNNNANMKTVMNRIAKLKRIERAEHKEHIFGDIKIIENPEENRVQILFNGKPSYEVRSEMKRNGFRYSPTNTMWMAYYSRYAIDKAINIIEKI